MPGDFGFCSAAVRCALKRCAGRSDTWRWSWPFRRPASASFAASSPPKPRCSRSNVQRALPRPAQQAAMMNRFAVVVDGTSGGLQWSRAVVPQHLPAPATARPRLRLPLQRARRLVPGLQCGASREPFHLAASWLAADALRFAFGRLRAAPSGTLEGAGLRRVTPGVASTLRPTFRCAPQRRYPPVCSCASCSSSAASVRYTPVSPSANGRGGCRRPPARRRPARRSAISDAGRRRFRVR